MGAADGALGGRGAIEAIGRGGVGAIGAPTLVAGRIGPAAAAVAGEPAADVEPGRGGVGRSEGFFFSSGLLPSFPSEEDKLDYHPMLLRVVPTTERSVACGPSVPDDAVVVDVPDRRDDLESPRGVGR